MKIIPAISLIDNFYIELGKKVDEILQEQKDIILQDRTLPHHWEPGESKPTPVTMKMPVIDFEYPQWIKNCFPMLYIFWREKPGKQRKFYRNKKSKNKKKLSRKTADQNNYSIISVPLFDPNDYGSAKRTHKHYGWPHIVAAVPMVSTELELKGSYRLPRFKNKNFLEWYWHRKAVYGSEIEPYEKELYKLVLQLENDYPCTATGQLKLI